ncbi:hypothetical protein GCM10025876_24130 [Demequina litorisediminis]|uniref:Uncharacterized protein n=1 Tax=Demequina litorisediminis TaxID=1849022 RepID=A0ABQ6IHL2_9MICO|nr:hypothetical protein GCM10025876_24130 [Demequina litorisediminis]
MRVEPEREPRQQVAQRGGDGNGEGIGRHRSIGIHAGHACGDGDHDAADDAREVNLPTRRVRQQRDRPGEHSRTTRERERPAPPVGRVGREKPPREA